MSYDIGAFGNVRSGSATDQPLDFVGGQGYQRDPDAGTMYVRARHYDPTTGEWLSADPIEGEPPYAYGYNSPTAFTDASGMQGKPKVVAAAPPDLTEDEALFVIRVRGNDAGPRAVRARLAANPPKTGPGATEPAETTLEVLRTTLKYQVHPNAVTENFSRNQFYEVEYMAFIKLAPRLRLKADQVDYLRRKLGEFRKPYGQGLDMLAQYRYPALPTWTDESGEAHWKVPLSVGYSEATRGTGALFAVLRGHLYVVVEVRPEAGTKLVRNVVVVPTSLKVSTRYGIEFERHRAGNPEKYGIQPIDPAANVSPGEHSLGRNQSPYISASESPIGSPMGDRPGRPVLIDVAKAQRAGVRVISVDDLVRELERLAAKENDPSARLRLDHHRMIVETIEREALLKGELPPEAVTPASGLHTRFVTKGEQARAQRVGPVNAPLPRQAQDYAGLQADLGALERSYSRARLAGRIGRVLTVIGIVSTAIDMTNAARESVSRQSIRPVVAEGIRQGAGWGGAWAGGQFGLAAGAALGIETGPGAVITGAAGAIVFGAMGYFLGDEAAKGWIVEDQDIGYLH